MKIQIPPPSHISGISCCWWLFAYPSKRRLCFEKLWDGQSRYGRGNLPPSSQGVALDFCEGETHTHRFPPSKVCAGKKATPNEEWPNVSLQSSAFGDESWNVEQHSLRTRINSPNKKEGKTILLFGKSTCFFKKKYLLRKLFGQFS